MLTSITPLGERAHSRRWAATTAWYVAGSVLGGLLIGLLAGLIGVGIAQARPADQLVVAISAVGCLVAAVWDLAAGHPPSWRRQVDEQWLRRYRGWVIGAGFGAQLGFGVLTIVTTASVYAALLLAVLTGSVWGGLLIGAAFGLVRALPLLTARRVTSPEALAGLHRSLASAAPLARRATAGVLLVTGAALAAAAAFVG